MKKHRELSIYRVSNGFVVRGAHRPGDYVADDEMAVFNVAGKAAEKDASGRLTLAGFIARHFADDPAA